MCAGRDDIDSTKDMTTDELERFTGLLEHARDLTALQDAVTGGNNSGGDDSPEPESAGTDAPPES